MSAGHRGSARVRLIEPRGLSLISDIDDTIKVTNIPAGHAVVIENTFYRPFVAAPGMAERYRGLGDETAFHYVSGAPWQLYRPLAQFITAAGYPQGSFHMKSVRKHLLTPGSWQDLVKACRRRGHDGAKAHVRSATSSATFRSAASSSSAIRESGIRRSTGRSAPLPAADRGGLDPRPGQ